MTTLLIILNAMQEYAQQRLKDSQEAQQQWVRDNILDDGWVSVDSLLPFHDQRVLALCQEHNSYYVAYLNKSHQWRLTADPTMIIVNKISHWQPLPLVPEKPQE